MYLLVMVLDNVDYLDNVLNAWMDAGVKGVTVLESTGINRVLHRTEARPHFAGFSQLFAGGRVGHNTLFAVIDSMDIATEAVAATEAITGDLTQPHTGLIFALPLAEVWGLPEPYARNAREDDRSGH